MKLLTRSFYLISVFATFLFGCASPQDSAVKRPDKVNQSLPALSIRNRVIYQGDAPFFWMGDTAWELFHRLTTEEAKLYLKNRKALGFNIIQAVGLAELEGLVVPNTNGDLPLKDKDPAQPIDAYFAHVDTIIDLANAEGLYVAFLPTWGDKFNLQWGPGPEIFTPENALAYGEYVGKRYQDKDIVWVLGGDRNVINSEDYEIIDAMAKGIKKYDTKHLMTYHTRGGSTTAQFFADKDWIDIHTFQSGHMGDNAFRYHAINKSIAPEMPSIDIEPRYEDHPVNWAPATLG